MYRSRERASDFHAGCRLIEFHALISEERALAFDAPLAKPRARALCRITTTPLGTFALSTRFLSRQDQPACSFRYLNWLKGDYTNRVDKLFRSLIVFHIFSSTNESAALVFNTRWTLFYSRGKWKRRIAAHLSWADICTARASGGANKRKKKQAERAR